MPAETGESYLFGQGIKRFKIKRIKMHHFSVKGLKNNIINTQMFST